MVNMCYVFNSQLIKAIFERRRIVGLPVHSVQEIYES